MINHHSVPITNNNIERIQHIVNQLIEKNEPLSKFTKQMILIDCFKGDHVEFDQVFKMLSSPISTSNKTVATHDDQSIHDNIPIVSGLEQLKMVFIHEFQNWKTSQLFQLLSQCHNLTHLEINNEEGCLSNHRIIKSISNPVLNSLKSIKINSTLGNGEIAVVLRILELAHV